MELSTDKGYRFQKKLLQQVKINTSQAETCFFFSCDNHKCGIYVLVYCHVDDMFL
ncbi:hypothetical protein Bca4012_015003 [Brassica carinata]